MLITLGILLVIVAFGLPLFVRTSDLPETEPASPTLHLEERKATIYENLRDLQAEYRMGKLSDEDYQTTKQDLQRELAETMAQIEAIGQSGAAA